MKPTMGKRTERRIWAYGLAVALLFVAALACNDHALNPFGSALRAGAVETTEQGDVRTVDILFVVDNSNSMCEEQKRLKESFNTFIQILATAKANFNLAVVNTDMVDLVGGQGIFRTSPGTYVENLASCSETIPDTSFCAGKALPKFLTSLSYGGLETPEQIAALQSDFSCMALTGIDGTPVEMGLEAARQALSRADQQDFFRPGSLLAIVYVSDENDCSDTTGTSGAVTGPVFPFKDNGCEWNRNIEDSCLLPDPNVTFDGLTALEVCVEGNRDSIAGLASELGVKCDPDPSTGAPCSNKLVARRTFYDFVVNKVAERNQYNTDKEGLAAAANDIIVAAIINTDAGVRYSSTEALDGNWCNGNLSFSTAGTQGYRYELFAQMFPKEHHVISPICDNTNGQAVNFGPPLQLIADVIGKAINSVCLHSKPMQCDPDGMDGETCKPGARCCPVGQTCNPERLLAGVEGFEYSVCSGFKVIVEERTPVPNTVCEKDSECVEPQKCGNGVCNTVNVLLRDEDYALDLESQSCASTTGSPIEIGLKAPPASGSSLVVSYPREVSSVYE
ncbi:MAG: hypothetical protein CO108_02650 [Deltaproteobacteria bacterium CG_4_9_14_3_um_filter_63_12]|nr:MAG: hypothetical protein CO108_02650 [Deltaproteobacteria bacterium CG_4_9_14_3_um_filter_63_12]